MGSSGGRGETGPQRPIGEGENRGLEDYIIMGQSRVYFSTWPADGIVNNNKDHMWRLKR